MSKRNFATTSNPPSMKKAKTNAPLDIWDDDFDEDAIDDCFKRATQTIANENQNDVTLATSYSIFKAPNRIFTSTQIEQVGGNLEEQVRQLQEKCAEKEGEVSILRSNLQNLRATCQADEERRQNEWKEKLSTIEKENRSIRSELEFKNLEVANLKQQINELSKLVNSDVNIPQNQIVSSPKKHKWDVPKADSKIYINVGMCHPLKNLNLCSVSNILANENQLFCQKKFLQFIQDDLPSLLQFSDTDFNSNSAQTHINKVLQLLEELLDNFVLCFGPTENYNSQLQEMSFMCSDILELVGQIFYYSEDLRSNLLYTKNNLMLLLSNIISSIIKNRKEKTCTRFLSSVINFLCKTLRTDDCFPEYSYINILNQFLILKLDLQLIEQVISFLSVLSICYTPFSETEKKEACKFHMFYDYIEAALQKTQNAELFRKITNNLLNFAYNVFRLNHSHQRECDCCHKLFKLIVRSVYENLELHPEECSKVPSMLKKCVNILSLINFNAYDSTQKYVSDFAQFKEIINKLVRMNAPNAEKLEKLCSNEDVLSISSHKFVNIDF